MLLPPDDPRLTPVHLRRELVTNGYDDRAIRRACQSGALKRIRRGAYADGPTWRSLDNAGRHAVLARAAERASNTGTVISHVSALPFHGAPTWGLDLSQAHLTRTDAAAGRAEAGIVQHRGKLLPGDVVPLADFSVTSPTRACLEVIAVTTPEPALVVINHMLHRGLTTIDGLKQRYAAGMEHWPDTLGANVVLRLANPLVESVGESRTFFLCWSAGLPLPQPQFSIRDSDGREMWRVDFAWPELGVWLEFDGKAKYSEYLRPGESPADAVVREKRREEAITAATGWICVRIMWDELARPALVVQRIREAFARRAR